MIVAFIAGVAAGMVLLGLLLGIAFSDDSEFDSGDDFDFGGH